MELNINFTNAACSYIKKMCEKKHGIGFRLSVKKTGCSGFSYFPEIIETVNDKDQVLDIDGTKIYIDTTWLHLFDGLQIDYIEEDKSGLKQKRLVFTNPNESSRCGCGESFQI